MRNLLKADNFLIIVGFLLIIGFIIRLGADYYQYQHTFNSAPFSAFIIWRSIIFLLPSAICFIIATYLKKRKDEK